MKQLLRDISDAVVYIARANATLLTNRSVHVLLRHVSEQTLMSLAAEVIAHEPLRDILAASLHRFVMQQVQEQFENMHPITPLTCIYDGDCDSCGFYPDDEDAEPPACAMHHFFADDDESDGGPLH